MKLRTLNPYISCIICRGYLIDATTVTECLHTFCKSCLVKHLEEKNTCPKCRIVIHQSHPLQYISYDRTLQDVVYKLVPDMQKCQERRQKEFYRSRGLPYPKEILEKSQTDCNQSVPETVETTCNFHKSDEQMGVQLLSLDEKQMAQLREPFLRCSSQTTIKHLKKFLATKFFKEIEKQRDIDILYNEELLGKDHTLKFVYVTRWRLKHGPLKLFYRPSQRLFN